MIITILSLYISHIISNVPKTRLIDYLICMKRIIMLRHSFIHSFIHNLSGDTHIAHYSIYPFLHHQLILYEEMMNEPEQHIMMMDMWIDIK